MHCRILFIHFVFLGSKGDMAQCPPSPPYASGFVMNVNMRLICIFWVKLFPQKKFKFCLFFSNKKSPVRWKTSRISKSVKNPSTKTAEFQNLHKSKFVSLLSDLVTHDWKQTRLVAVIGLTTSQRHRSVKYSKPQMWTLLWRSTQWAWYVICVTFKAKNGRARAT